LLPEPKIRTQTKRIINGVEQTVDWDVGPNGTPRPPSRHFDFEDLDKKESGDYVPPPKTPDNKDGSCEEQNGFSSLLSSQGDTDLHKEPSGAPTQVRRSGTLKLRESLFEELSIHRSRAETRGSTFESEPAESTADAVHAEQFES